MAQQPQGGDTRNLIIAVVLSMAVFVAWFVIFPPADKAKQEAKQQAAAEATVPTVTPQGDAAFQHQNREAALAQDGGRVVIDTPAVDGSIRLKGARFDDLNLKNYRTTIDPKSPEITLLEPVGVMNPLYGEFGWTAEPGATVALPNAETVWRQASGDVLSPGKPVGLEWDNGAGLTFRRTLSIDENYMLSIEDSVENKSGAAVKLFPYGAIVRGGVPFFHKIWVVHQGMVGVMNGTLHEKDYDEIVEEGARIDSQDTTGGWLGFTDHYFMASLIPDQAEPVTATFRAANQGTWERYQADFVYTTAREVAPGATTSVTHRLFAGAKVVSLVDKYAENGIQRFDMAVDWGWFFFLTKPIFLVMDWLFSLIGNFGVAILLLTVMLKALFFPLANKSYESMAKMKKIQPEMVALRERWKEDPAKQQQEMMALYRREKVNPVAGCLPLLLQIPVFFSLYKVLYVTIEMRHAPFFGWIQDLSAPDPTSVFNLFGLIPYALPTFLVLGAWPIINGLVMWVQMKMNPPAPDPVQQRLFGIMPWIFMFMLAAFPAGLVIYWAWNGLLSVTQQYVILRRTGAEVHLFDNLKKSWPARLFVRAKS
ncbi:Membrane protein insertase YidC [Alphaproteobacteria bacterium SO-S41]|nr:Membrane protein insertase YidC [Alphaproteobacteria bacterium SO-S41]